MNMFIIATAARLAAEVVTGGPCHIMLGCTIGTLYEINYGRELIARVTTSCRLQSALHVAGRLSKLFGDTTSHLFL